MRFTGHFGRTGPKVLATSGSGVSGEDRAPSFDVVEAPEHPERDSARQAFRLAATTASARNYAETAKTAVETFSEAERQILELEPFLLLPHEGTTAIAAQVTGAMIVL